MLGALAMFLRASDKNFTLLRKILATRSALFPGPERQAELAVAQNFGQPIEHCHSCCKKNAPSGAFVLGALAMFYLSGPFPVKYFRR